MKTARLFGVLCAFCLVAMAQNKVKILEWSWSNPSVSYLEKNLPRMIEECPHLDGLVCRISSESKEIDGKKWKAETSNAWNKRPWKYELFANEIARFNKLDFGHFTDNFIYMTTSQVDFDWFNDDDFATVAANFGVAARVAKEIGFKGLGVDIEEYGRKFWHMSDLKERRSLKETDATVFKRGQEWGRAVFGAYPDIVLFMPFCLTMGADLTIPFMNGVINVMPPTAVIYDGFEGAGYRAKKPEAYGNMQNRLRKIFRKNLRPENLRKARGQVLLAPAFYLDAYFTHGEDSRWRMALEPERTELGPVKMFARNFLAASEEAEPYIWIYGEQASWWSASWHPRAKKTWDELCGDTPLSKELLFCKNPSMTPIDVPENLVPNYDFKQVGKWKLWQREHDMGKPEPGDGEIKDGRCVIHKVTSGCFNLSIPIKPNQNYFFLCKGGTVNDLSGVASASLCFRDTQGRWMASNVNTSLKFPSTGKEETVWAFVTAPEGAGSVSVQCGVSGQVEGGEAFFTGILLMER
ncbi:MAG: hypothetical protein J6X55_03655 [Victivallales bacterium]|nr:hypothetical protein [Victivallales bacterium]